MINEASKGQQSGFPLRQEKEVSRGRIYASASEISENGFSSQNCSSGAASPPGTELMMWLIASMHRVIMTDTGQAA